MLHENMNIDEIVAETTLTSRECPMCGQNVFTTSFSKLPHDCPTCAHLVRNPIELAAEEWANKQVMKMLERDYPELMDE